MVASANQTHTHTHIFSRLTWQHTHAHAHTHTHTHLSLRWDVAELCLELLFTMLLRNRDRISALWPRVYAHFQVCVSVLVCTHARKHQCAVAESVCTLSGNVCVRLSFSLHSCPQASVCCGRKCMHTVRCVCLSFSLHSCPQASVR